MRIIDLTHTMHDDMPVFPGDQQPEVYSIYTVEEDGFAQKRLVFYSHTGTHIDAPAHMLAKGNSLGEMNIEQFFGQAIILDCSKRQESKIELQDLVKYENKIKEVEFILLKTGWEKYWGSEYYFENFPSLTEEAVKWLCNFNLKGIGIDTLSIDDIQSTDFSLHHQLLKNNLIIIENLTNLDKVQEEIFTFSCLPLKYEKADGSPVRAVAVENLINIRNEEV